MIKDLSARASVPAKLVSGPCPTLIQTSSAERILSEYDQYLDRTLGAALSTRRGYLYFAHQFLTFAFRPWIQSGKLYAPNLSLNLFKKKPHRAKVMAAKPQQLCSLSTIKGS